VPLTLLALCVQKVAENLLEYPYLDELPEDIYVTVCNSWKSLYLPHLAIQVSSGVNVYERLQIDKSLLKKEGCSNK
jgi:hypothetical protein